MEYIYDQLCWSTFNLFEKNIKKHLKKGNCVLSKKITYVIKKVLYI